ncbi:hypothetical protein [Bradyrhizobium sp.]|jgi:hypothetical protein|uniref:hypothetical protein n=1 Tax=Bradyrhizobium sp. TaxID=376 RepID=UPI003C16A779
MSSISSIPASPPIAPVVNAPDPSASKSPDVTAADDAGATQPAALAPLPPGQGTRIDQIA